MLRGEPRARGFEPAAKAGHAPLPAICAGSHGLCPNPATSSLQGRDAARNAVLPGPGAVIAAL